MADSELGCTEQLWFKIIIIIIGAVILAFSIANAVFYGRISGHGGCNSSISGSTATIMMWINIVLALLSFVLIAFGIWRLVLSYERRKKIQSTVSTKVQSAATSTKSVENVVPVPVRKTETYYAPSNAVPTSTDGGANIVTNNAQNMVNAAQSDLV